MIPEGKLIKSEIVIRDMALPSDVKLSRDSTIRWLALSLGLISPNESRTSLLVVLDVLIEAHKEGERLTSAEIIDRVKEKKDIDDKTVYYHLKRLQQIGLIERKDGTYGFGDGFETNLSKIIREAYLKRINAAMEKIDEVIRSL